MNRRLSVLLAALLLVVGAIVVIARRAAKLEPSAAADGGGVASPTGPRPLLKAVGPRLLSNQTSTPVTIYGERLTAGAALELGPPVNDAVSLTVVDSGLAYARLPAELDLPEDQAMVVVTARVEGGEGEAQLSIVNDADYPDFFALAVLDNGDRYVISPTTDTLYVVRGEDPPYKVKTADGPYAIAAAGDRVWIAHRFAPVLRSYAGLVQQSELPAPAFASALVVDARKSVAYVAEIARDSVAAIDLQSGKELWRTPVMPNPGVLELCGGTLAVGSQQAGEIELLNPQTGEVLGQPISPGPEVKIIGGGTEAFAHRTMGGKAPRALRCSPRHDALFVSSIGPNIGPNPEKMEVSMNGGVGVIDMKTRRFVRHVGFGAGVTEGLALSANESELYAADIALGVVRTLDVKALVTSDAAARRALKRELALPVREGFALARADGDYGVSGRAGKELHAGPRAVSAVSGGFIALNRHTGTLVTSELHSVNLDEVKAQPSRRTGQVLYFADMGRTAMSCDSCHPEGHTEGLLFEKTQPLRIYRVPTVRGSLDTPPYFIPASTFSVADTAKTVGGRNRLHNPDLTEQEIEALAQYSALITLLPNPFHDERGAPLDPLTLPDGRRGSPSKGRALFDKQGCAECHPPPLFSSDQDARTRGKHVDVGTPRLFPLRPDMQDGTFKGFPPPSLLGGWDIWPQLTTGLAGFDVTDSGRLRVKDRYATRVVLERFSSDGHGAAQALSPEERNDLLAFLMTL